MGLDYIVCYNVFFPQTIKKKFSYQKQGVRRVRKLDLEKKLECGLGLGPNHLRLHLRFGTKTNQYEIVYLLKSYTKQYLVILVYTPSISKK